MKAPSLVTASLALAASVSVTGQEIELNDTRRFQVTERTVVTRNDVTTALADLIQIGTGYRAKIQIGTGAAGRLVQGALVSIDFDDRLVGPVTNVNPLTVLSVPVVTTGDTARVGIPGDDVANLNVGDVVRVSGYTDSNSSVRASRIERPAQPPGRWGIEGFATNVSASAFSIGLQTVDYAAATIEDCPGDAVTEGRFVEVEITPLSAYSPGDLLVADEVECEDDRIVGDGPAVVDGLITALTGPNGFLVGEQPVASDLTTRYVNGTVADVRPGVRVEVEGSVDPGTGVLAASRVRFRDAEVRFEAPVGPDDIVDEESITILGNTLAVTAQTRAEDDLLDDGVDRETQVEVRGFIDRAGNLFATEVEEQGEPELGDVDLRGPAAAIAPPGLTILGVRVDTSAADFADAFGQPVSAQEFFALIGEGTSVGVEGGQYDPVANTLSGGTVSIETEGDDDRDDGDDDDDDDGPSSKGAEVGGRGIGIVTRVTAPIFADGFE